MGRKKRCRPPQTTLYGQNGDLVGGRGEGTPDETGHDEFARGRYRWGGARSVGCSPGDVERGNHINAAVLLFLIVISSIYTRKD